MQNLRVLSLIPILGAIAPAQQVSRELRGIASERFGAAVVGLGDIDGDGYPDLAVGAPQRGNGAIDFFSGRTGQRLRSATDALSTQLGRTLFSAGDIDRDAAIDLWADTPEGLVAFSSRSGGVLWRYPRSELVAAAGDVDGDGHADLLAAARSVGGQAVSLAMSGRTGAALWVITAPGRNVLALGSAGDVNRDGHADLIWTLGDPSGILIIEVRSGRDTSVLFTINGQPQYGHGERVGTVGDYNGDGRDDVFLWQPRTPAPPTFGIGRVTVFSALDNTVLAEFDGQAYCDRYGSCMQIRTLENAALGGDIDGDGQVDPLLTFTDGAILRSLTGAELMAPTAIVANMGDLDRDGRADLVTGFPALGLVRIVRGGTRERVVPPPSILPLTGATREIVNIGDTDRDGHDDLAISALGSGTSGTVSSCSLISGRTGAPLTSFAGSLGFLTVVRAAAAGDVDGDGRGDVVVGWNSGAFPPDEHRAEVWSGGARRFRIDDPDQTFGVAVAGGADWNSDSVPDVFIAATTFTDVCSGLDGSRIVRLGAGADRLTMVGDLDGDGVGDVAIGAAVWASSTRGSLWTLASPPVRAGDVDRDGRGDVWVAEPAGATLYSGRTRLLLTSLPWPGGTPATALAAGFDWDGDGTGDLALGAAAELPAGMLRVISGRNGSELFARSGDRTVDALGGTVAVIGAPAAGSPGVAATSARGGRSLAGYSVWIPRPDLSSGGVASSGQGCDGAFGAPRLGWLGRPVPGLASAMRTTHLATNALGAVLLGASEDQWAGQPLPLTLTFLGVQDCALRTSPDVVLPVAANAQGIASLPLTIPADASLIGGRVGVQGIHRDALAPGGWTLSNGLRLVIGQ